MLVLISISVSLLFAAQARADRAMWVWGAAGDIALNPANNPTAQQDFINFCLAPHGSATNRIDRVFFDAVPYGTDLIKDHPAQLRSFLTAAHNNSIKVEFLSGDKSWAVPASEHFAENTLTAVLNFNKGGTAEQRFDGIHYDVEPYLLNTKDGRDPLDWRYDQGLIWGTYLAMLTNCQSAVAAYNASYSPAIRFGVAIPFWYVLNSTPGPQEIIDRVDYVAVMGYRDTVSGITSADMDCMQYAATVGKKVYVSVETAHPTDTAGFPPRTTFYEEGNAALETAFGEIYNAFSAYSSYAGIAIHYYEDLTGTHGSEFAYRSLSVASKPHYPIVSISSPGKGDIFAGTINILWQATTLDGYAITPVNIYYSADGGANWSELATGLSNSGSYIWDTSSDTFPAGPYSVKIVAVGPSPESLTGFAVSKQFSIAKTVTQTPITDLYAWPDTGTSITLVWTPPACAPRYYNVWRSVNGAAFTQIETNRIAVAGYKDTGLSAGTRYRYKIYPIYGDGAAGGASNISNMLTTEGTLPLDYFEGVGDPTGEIEGVTYSGPYGLSTLTYSPSMDVNNVFEGTKSIQLNYAYVVTDPVNWGAILIGNRPVPLDAAAYAGIRLWVKGGAAGQKAFAIKLYERGRTEGNEEWISPFITVSNPSGEEVTVNFSDFTLDSTAGNRRLDLHTIGGYGLVFGPTTVNGTYFVDKMRFVSLAAELTVSPAQLSFGMISPVSGNHRFRIGPITVGYVGLNQPWTIRIWTNNGGGAGHAGLKGANGSSYIPLKVWCANYGPTPAIPDQNDDAYWVNNEAGWFRVPESSEMASNNVFTWRRFCWSPGGELTNPFDFYVAIDAAGSPNQDYQTNTLTVECINQ